MRGGGCVGTAGGVDSGRLDGPDIVVIDGEDGVNIVKRGSAVAPVVEVRDRNNLPVAGAVVTFVIPGGSKAASFAGNARQLAIATDSSGRATASLQAVGKGAFRVDISASYQGETATTSITQTNFASAAEAAKAGKTVGSQQSSGNASNGSNASRARRSPRRAPRRDRRAARARRAPPAARAVAAEY